MFRNEVKNKKHFLRPIEEKQKRGHKYVAFTYFLFYSPSGLELLAKGQAVAFITSCVNPGGYIPHVIVTQNLSCVQYTIQGNGLISQSKKDKSPKNIDFPLNYMNGLAVNFKMR